jgi:hypothetical protein
LDALSNHS